MRLEEKREKTEVGEVSLIPVCWWSHEVPQLERLCPDPLGQGQTLKDEQKREKSVGNKEQEELLAVSGIV